MPTSLLEKPVLMSLLRHHHPSPAASSPTPLTPSAESRKRRKGGGGGGVGILKMFKLIPMLTTGCKVAAMLGKSGGVAGGKALLSGGGATITLFGHRRGKSSLAIQDDVRSPPVFLVELPMLTSHLHREMASGQVRIALESETTTAKRRLIEEHVWAVYCNGRKSGYSIRRREPSDDERHVMQLLRWVSVGAGVLPAPGGGGAAVAVGVDGELTYMRARFERVVGSKDSESLYMINPDGSGGAPELTIFLVRVK